MNWTYESLREVVRGRRLPLVLVDLERFDANLRHFTSAAARHGKSIRIASKSIRVPTLLQRAFQVGEPVTHGVMCYSAAEAVYLALRGFDDLLVAYPTVQPNDLTEVGSATRTGKNITLTVDSLEQIEPLAEQWRELRMSTPLRICLEMDVSWRPLGLHVGAQRSPLRSIGSLEKLMDVIARQPELEVVGVMGYESQLAGVTDDNPSTPWRNRAVRIMKRFSRPDVLAKRKQLEVCLQRRGMVLKFFNGGGTGSFPDAVTEPCLTEVTVGSGLLQSQLFDYYVGASCEPALCFVLPVTRCSQVDRVTCHGGGFIASGATGSDRSPVPIFPAGLRSDPREGFGEVQTPLIVPLELQGRIRVGDPIFFRPAKAGEIAERFNTYCLMESGRIIDEVPTYRGLGQCFH